MRGMRHIKQRAAAPTPQLRGPRYAPPYDFSVFLPTFSIMGIALGAACKFSGVQAAPGAKAPLMGG